jgi:ribosomal protein L11 methyltransferase
VSGGAGTWLECSTLAEAEAVDAVAELFSTYGQGVAIEEPVVSSADGEQVTIDPSRPVVVKTYLPLDEQTEERRQRLEQAIWHLGRLRQVEPLQTRPIEERDWADAWKRYFFVHRVGERLVIVPSWRRHRSLAGDLIIRLDPGMAFGTGLHPTTRLCLRGLETRIQGGENVLDLGTGSGILAIAARKLGARHILAMDVDAMAVRVAGENARRNRVAHAIETRLGSLPLGGAESEKFDLIVANISFRVLRELHPELRKALRPSGRALLSGVLEHDAPALIDALESAGWRLLTREIENEWALLEVVPSLP